jgi:hypothetical protein
VGGNGSPGLGPGIGRGNGSGMVTAPPGAPQAGSSPPRPSRITTVLAQRAGRDRPNVEWHRLAGRGREPSDGGEMRRPLRQAGKIVLRRAQVLEGRPRPRGAKLSGTSAESKTRAFTSARPHQAAASVVNTPIGDGSSCNRILRQHSDAPAAPGGHRNCLPALGAFLVEHRHRFPILPAPSSPAWTRAARRSCCPRGIVALGGEWVVRSGWGDVVVSAGSCELRYQAFLPRRRRTARRARRSCRPMSPCIGGCSAAPLCFIEAARPLRHCGGDRWFVDEIYVDIVALLSRGGASMPGPSSSQMTRASSADAEMTR